MSTSTMDAFERIEALVGESFRLKQAKSLVEYGPMLQIRHRIIDSSASKSGDVRKLLLRRAVHLRSEIRELLEETGANVATLLDGVTLAFRSGTCDEASMSVLIEPLTRRCEEIDRAASKVPASFEKGRCYLRACIKYSHDNMEALNLFSHLVADNHPAVLEHLNTLLEDKIPSPPLGVEHEHDIAWYIFLQRFGDGEVRAQAFRAKIEVGFRRSIQAYTSDIEDRRNSNLPVDVGGAAWVLWLINQSFPLSRSLKLEAAKLAYALSTIQHADGCWRFDDTDWDDQNILNTALCLLVLYKFYKGRDLTERADRAATWLCLQQDPCGGWRESEVRSLSDEFDILTTAIARHALEMSGLPNWGGHVTRADAFLLSRQHPLGFWVQRPYWSQFVTSTVLMSVSVDHRSFPDSVENHHLKAARDFLTRGQELLETADTGNWPLGIVALYHGLEFLLYGCFVQLNPQISIWQLKQTSLTIGLRDALTAFRAWLAGHDVAGPPLPFEQQIRGLASLRDGVVHRGDEISPAARDQALRDAQGFVTTHAKVLLPPEVPIEAIWPGMVHKAREPS